MKKIIKNTIFILILVNQPLFIMSMFSSSKPSPTKEEIKKALTQAQKDADDLEYRLGQETTARESLAAKVQYQEEQISKMWQAIVQLTAKTTDAHSLADAAYDAIDRLRYNLEETNSQVEKIEETTEKKFEKISNDFWDQGMQIGVVESRADDLESNFYNLSSEIYDLKSSKRSSSSSSPSSSPHPEPSTCFSVFQAEYYPKDENSQLPFKDNTTSPTKDSDYQGGNSSKKPRVESVATSTLIRDMIASFNQGKK